MVTRKFVFVWLALPLGCWLGSDSRLPAQVEQTKGVQIVAKRSADLPNIPENERQSKTINIDDVHEFDRINGRCVSKNKSPVSNATILLFRKTVGRDGADPVEELVAETETDAQGEFLLEDLQSRFPTSKFEQSFIMVVRKVGFAAKFLSSITWKPGAQEIELSGRAMVKGTIKNDQGQPIADASVAFYHPLKQSLPEVYATRTDAAGRFEIDDYHTVNSIAYQTADGKTKGSMALPLTVVHPEHGTVGLKIERTPNLFFVTISRGVKVIGKLVDSSGNPVAESQISMQSHNHEPSIWFQTESDSEGRFEFTKIADVRANLFFRTPELIGQSIEVSGSPGTTIELGAIKLRKPVLMRGVVIDDETDQPIRLKEGLRYSIGWHGPERPETSAGISSAQIQPDGTFECRFLPGKNYPYVASGYLQVVDRPYRNGIMIDDDTDVTLEFRVRKKNPDE